MQVKKIFFKVKTNPVRSWQSFGYMFTQLMR